MSARSDSNEESNDERDSGLVCAQRREEVSKLTAQTSQTNKERSSLNLKCHTLNNRVPIQWPRVSRMIHPFRHPTSDIGISKDRTLIAEWDSAENSLIQYYIKTERSHRLTVGKVSVSASFRGGLERSDLP